MVYARVAGAACAKTCWATATVTSLAALACGGKVEGSKSDHSSLEEILDCVVHARVAGAARAKYVLGVSVEVTSLSALAGGGRVEGSKSDQAIVGDGGWAEMSAAGVLLL